MKKIFAPIRHHRILSLIALMAIVFACTKQADNPNFPTPSNPEDGWFSFPSSENLSPVIPAEGGSITISFSAYGDWQLSDSKVRLTEWLTVSPSSGKKGNNTITINAEANNSYDERNATIKLTGGTETKCIVVTQKQKDAITISKSKFEVSPFGEEITVEVNSNIDFSFKIDDDASSWISAIETKAMTSKSISFKVLENEEKVKREGTITFSSGDIKELIKIYQEGAKPTIILSQSEYAIGQDGGVLKVDVRSNIDVSYSIPSETDWITEASTKSLSTSTFYFLISKNESYESRTGEIFFKNEENGLSEKIIVTQVQKDALVVAQDSYNVNNKGGQIEIEIGHNIDFDIDFADSWISKASTKSYTTDKLLFLVEENATTENRETKITFSSKDKNISQIVKIYQSQTNALLLSETQKAISADGGIFSIEVNHNVDFKIEMPDIDWITLIETKAMSTSTKSFSVLKNETYDTRTATIVVKSNDGSLSDNIIVTQMPKGAIIVAKDEYVFDRSGGNFTVKVNHTVEFDVEISEGWITEVSTKTFSSTTKTFSIAKNTSGKERKGYIIFKSKDKTITQNILIRQGIIATIITNDKSITFENDGGKSVIEINPDVNFDYDIVFPDNTDYDQTGWLSTTSIKEPRIHLTAKANSSYDIRRALLIVKDIDTEKLDTAKIFVKQKEYLKTEKTIYELSYLGGECTISFDSSYDYLITMPENAPWLRQIETKAINTNSIKLYAEANELETSREAVVKISLKDGTLYENITVKQNSSVYSGNYTINNHDDVIYLRDNKFKKISGDLTIKSNPSDLDNMIEVITGNLTIIDTQCDGLYGLKSVGGHLTLDTLYSEGLNNLMRVDGIVCGKSFESMSSLNYVGGLQLFGSPKGLTGLTSINGDLEVCGKINDFDGLNNLTKIEGHFKVLYDTYTIYRNKMTDKRFQKVAYFKSFNGLGSLSVINGDFFIKALPEAQNSAALPNLESFEGLNSLTKIGGDFIIENSGHCASYTLVNLTSIDIPSLQSIGGIFKVKSTKGLTSLRELKMGNLSVISGGSLIFKTGTKLTRGLPSISSLETLDIDYEFPDEESGFPALKYLGGSLGGTGFGFHNLETIGGNCSVSNGTNLKKLKTVKGNANLSGDGYNLLTSVGGQLEITGTTISGLKSLKEVSDLYLRNVNEITGLGSLETISNNLTITNCATLSNVENFSSLSTCKNISITNCSNLYDFTAFTNAVKNGSSWSVTGCGYNPTKYQMQNGQSKP